MAAKKPPRTKSDTLDVAGRARFAALLLETLLASGAAGMESAARRKIAEAAKLLGEALRMTGRARTGAKTSSAAKIAKATQGKGKR